MRHVAVASSLALLLALAGRTARAEVPPLSEADLLAMSTHVVVGRVEAHYRTERTKEPGHRDEHVVSEILVSKVEKAAATDAERAHPSNATSPKEGQVLYARWWHASQRPEGWAGPSGLNVEIDGISFRGRRAGRNHHES